MLAIYVATYVVTVHITMHIITYVIPLLATDIFHLIHLSSGPVARFSLKIHASINVAYVKILKSFVAIVHVMRINNQPTVYRSFL